MTRRLPRLFVVSILLVLVTSKSIEELKSELTVLKEKQTALNAKMKAVQSNKLYEKVKAQAELVLTLRTEVEKSISQLETEIGTKSSDYDLSINESETLYQNYKANEVYQFLNYFVQSQKVSDMALNKDLKPICKNYKSTCSFILKASKNKEDAKQGEKLKDPIDKAYTKVSSLKEQIKRKSNEINNLIEQIQSKTEELENLLRTKLVELKPVSEETLASLKQALSGLKTNLIASKADLSAKESELTNAQQEQTNFNTKVSELNSQVKATDKEILQGIDFLLDKYNYNNYSFYKDNEKLMRDLTRLTDEKISELTSRTSYLEKTVSSIKNLISKETNATRTRLLEKEQNIIENEIFTLKNYLTHHKNVQFENKKQLSDSKENKVKEHENYIRDSKQIKKIIPDENLEQYVASLQNDMDIFLEAFSEFQIDEDKIENLEDEFAKEINKQKLIDWEIEGKRQEIEFKLKELETIWNAPADWNEEEAVLLNEFGRLFESIEQVGKQISAVETRYKEQPIEPEKKEEPSSSFWIWFPLILVLVVILASVGFLFYRKRNERRTSQENLIMTQMT